MSDPTTAPGGPPNAEFREAIVSLAKQARDEDLRAEEDLKKRLAKRPFTRFVVVGTMLIVLQLALYVYLSHLAPAVSKKKIERKSIFAENTCNAVLFQTYWKVIDFQRDQGHPPVILEEMLGKYLDKLPTDPKTGQTLLYSTNGDKFDLRCPGPPGKR